jgi:hypothetical protein
MKGLEEADCAAPACSRLHQNSCTSRCATAVQRLFGKSMCSGASPLLLLLLLLLLQLRSAMQARFACAVIVPVVRAKRVSVRVQWLLLLLWHTLWKQLVNGATVPAEVVTEAVCGMQWVYTTVRCARVRD